MFDDLRKLLITKNELGIPITFPVGLSAILGGIRVLDYLYAEEKGDYKQSEYPKIRLPADISAFEAFQSLKTRFMSRITSYIITVCTIDGILRQSYTHFIKCLRQVEYISVVPSDDGVAQLRQRREEIKDYLFYRHKVFAHTAFDSPRKDSRSLQYSSLYYFSGNLFYVKDEYFALGGGSVIVDKEETPPELSIVKGHSNLREHYSLWEHMFTDILKKIPREELESKIDKIRLM